MSANPIENNTTPKTTGSLEELFRHHLGEAAAVPPRPMLWDQLDNSLLIRQNETYRRRLAATRWVAAASLLLATLAGAGWWAGRTQLLSEVEMATSRQPTATDNQTSYATGKPGLNGRVRQSDAPLAANRPASTGGNASVGQGSTINNASINNGANGLLSNGQILAAAKQPGVATAAKSQYSGFGPASTARYSAGRNGLAPVGRATIAGTMATVAARETAASANNAAAVPTNFDEPVSNPTTSQMLAAADAASAAAANGIPAAASSVASAADVLSSGTMATSSLTASAVATGAPEEVSLLAAHPAALSLTDATALPAGLATVPVEDLPATAAAHHWRYGASYTAGVFNPNINFSRAGIEPAFDYDRGPAFGTDSPTLTEVAATEYRNNLRPGLSQRIALLATRHLRGHWSLSTGAELAQATAQSASSSAFVGEQLFDLGQGATARPMHTTNFRYSMASLPLEVRYSNPVKRGWGLYGRLGGVVTALLGVRSDVEGDPEATRSYSITSTGGPYRHISGSLRAGAGTQFRTSTGKWAFTVGPVAEIGLVAMNAHPVQSYFAQSRPYSFGLEAGVEFGR